MKLGQKHEHFGPTTEWSLSVIDYGAAEFQNQNCQRIGVAWKSVTEICYNCTCVIVYVICMYVYAYNLYYMYIVDTSMCMYVSSTSYLWSAF